MSKVIKKQGKFVLEPEAAQAARSKKEADLSLLQKELSSADLRGLLERILLRLEHLETK